MESLNFVSIQWVKFTKTAFLRLNFSYEILNSKYEHITQLVPKISLIKLMYK